MANRKDIFKNLLHGLCDSVRLMFTFVKIPHRKSFTEGIIRPPAGMPRRIGHEWRWWAETRAAAGEI